MAALAERRHHILGEPAQLFLEFLGRDAFCPMDHEMLEAGISRRDRFDAVDHLSGWAAEPRLLRDAVAQGRHPRRCARHAPAAPRLVGIAHEAERREPFVALVMRWFDAAHRLRLAVGEEYAGALDDILAETLLPPVLAARRVIGAHHLVEDLLAVQGHHRLEAVTRHHLDRLAAGDRHPDLDRQMLRPRNHRDVLHRVAAIGYRRRALEILALVMEALLVEAFEEQLELLLEIGAIGFGIEQRRAEGLDLTGVIAAADAHDDAPVGNDVRHRIVFRQADRVPHRQHVEGATELEAFGLRRQPEAKLDEIRHALIALALEMMLGGPQRVKAERIHLLRDLARGSENLAQPLARIAPLVGRRAAEPEIVELDLTDIEDMELLDHGAAEPR